MPYLLLASTVPPRKLVSATPRSHWKALCTAPQRSSASKARRRGRRRRSATTECCAPGCGFPPQPCLDCSIRHMPTAPPTTRSRIQPTHHVLRYSAWRSSTMCRAPRRTIYKNDSDDDHHLEDCEYNQELSGFLHADVIDERDEHDNGNRD